MADDCKDDSGHLNYSPVIGAYVSTYDDVPPSVAITEALAEITDKDMTGLEPLQKATALDVDALDDLFRPTIAGAPRRGGQLEFTYYEYVVRVFSSGRIEIEPPDEDGE